MATECGEPGRTATVLGECEGQRPPDRSKLGMETQFGGEQINKIQGIKAVHVVRETDQK